MTTQASFGFTRLLVVGTLTVAFVGPALADDPKEKKKDDVGPKVMLVSPLVTSAGEKLTLRLRGTGLETAKEIAFPDAKSPPKVTIRTKEKSDPPKPFDAKAFGDTQVEVELEIPSNTPAGELAISVVTEKGKTEPRKIRVLPAGAVVGENEPNGGFKEARAVDLGKEIRGAIGQEADVDVFKISGKAGEKFVVEVIANAAGSPLDPLLVLYNARGAIIAQADDAGSVSRDPVLHFTMPAGDSVYLSLTDASDRGSAMHTYRLKVRREASADSELK